MSWLYHESKLWWFLLLMGATLVLIWIKQSFFVSDVLYYNTYGDQLSIETIEMIIGSAKKYGWASYVFSPLLLLLRVTMVGCCFYIVLFFKNEKPDFSSCLNIALKSDTVFLLFSLYHLIYHLIVPVTYLADLSLSPLSFLYYIDVQNVPQYLLYPLSLINVSELLYWGLMVGLVRYKYRFSTSDSFFFILYSYGVGLLIMVLLFAIILM